MPLDLNEKYYTIKLGVELQKTLYIDKIIAVILEQTKGLNRQGREGK